jgi:hypothetical protein
MNDFFKQFDEASREFHKAHFQSHQDAHKRAQEFAKKDFFSFDFNSLFDDDYASELGLNTVDGIHSNLGDLFGGFGAGGFDAEHMRLHTQHSPSTHGKNCRTVTRREGNSVSTITQCQ